MLSKEKNTMILSSSKANSLKIEGKPVSDYFEILCSQCGNPTRNEYLGYDPYVPRVRAVCAVCGESKEWKLPMWDGLPIRPSR
jgi:hypothetical protein